MSVDLPEPEGPMIAAKRRCGEHDARPVQRVDRRLALAVAAAEVLCGDDRAVAIVWSSSVPRVARGGCQFFDRPWTCTGSPKTDSCPVPPRPNL